MLSSFGDLALSGILRGATHQAKADLSRSAQEMTTGQTTSPARHLNGDLSAISAIDARLSVMDGHAQVTRAAALQLETMQAGLARLAEGGEALGQQMRLALQSNLPDALDATAGLARGAFDDAVAILNTQVAGRSLFAGTAPEGPALAPADDIMAALRAALPPAADVPALVAAVSGWFADPAGFAQAAYLGGPPQGAPMRLSPEATAPAPDTALAPEITAHLAALALGALLGSAPQLATPQARAAMAGAGAEALLSAQAGMTALQSRTGLSEARVATAEARNTAERHALSIARNDLLGVDPFEAATRLEAARGQIEALYTLTARLSRLSLLEYLR
jgi:flagellar hook-associated protein 3 FlgL